MKKQVKIIMLLIATMFLFTFSVKAEGVSIKCPDTATVGKPFTCKVITDQTVYISTDLRVYKGSTTMTKNGDIEFKANEANDYDIGIISEDGSTTFDTKTVSVKPETTASKATTTTTKAKSDNNYLSSISVNGEKIYDFSKNTSKYFIEVENNVKSVDIKAQAEDSSSSVKIDGPKSLEEGDNEFTISVTSENDTTKFYKVIVTRRSKEPSSDTSIKKIKIKGYHFNFDKNSKTFYLTIAKEDTELDITVKTTDKKASYEISGNEDLKEGSIIKIEVKAEDDTTDTYRIIIEKEKKNNLPIIISILLLIIVITVIIFVIIKKKNKDNKNKKGQNKKQESIKTNEASYSDNKEDDESTIEMPSFNSSLENESEYDNDEEEKTRMLSYDEKEELEQTKILDTKEEIRKAFNDTFDDDMMFKRFDDDDNNY